MFDNTASNDEFQSATITYGPPLAEFDIGIGRIGLFFGDRPIPKAPATPLRERSSA